MVRSKVGKAGYKSLVRMIKRFVKILIVILIIVFGLTYGFKKSFPKMYLDSVERYANKHELDPLLVLSIIKVESNFDNEAVSEKGAKGLLQIMEPTAHWVSRKMDMPNYSPDMLYNPDCNINIGVWYLKWLYDKYNNMDLAIIAYNGGMGNVDKWLKDKNYSDDGKTLLKIPFEETSNYLLKVKSAYKVYKFLYE